MSLRILSTVLGWDKKELKKRIDTIEKGKNAPSKAVQDALKKWIEASREEHLECRHRSSKYCVP